MLKIILVILIAFAGASFGEENPLLGIETGDINRDVDPCIDFYEFSNGTWRANNPIPPTMTRWSRRFAAGEAVKDQLREILETSAKQQNPGGSTDQLIGDFYSACMNESSVNELGIKPLQPWLDQVDAIKDKDGLNQMMIQMHQSGIGVPFLITGSSDNHEPAQVIAFVLAGGLGLPDRDYYFKTEQRFVDAREKYKVHVSKMFQLAGYSAEAALDASQTVFQMETQFAEASLDRVSLRDPHAIDHNMPFEDLKKLTPGLNWDAFFEKAALPTKGHLNVTQPKFMEEVERRLKENSVSDWKQYLKWHLLHETAEYLSAPLVEEDWSFNRQYLFGAKEMKPRWKRCTEFTDAFLGEALGKKYTDEHFPPEAKAKMLDLVKNLLAAMKDDINSLEWMGSETKKKALEKLATFNPKIGYPDRWKDYSTVSIGKTSFWQNVLSGSKFLVKDDWFTIGKPVDRNRWGMTPPTSNAYYNPLLNEIVFPAGILQPPAFSIAATDAVNYGAIGVVIGHEISHGFDDEGAQYDAQGRLQNWWTESDLKQFEERGACVAEQFDSYYIEEGVHHNGKLVLGESIGDLGGAKIAYMAWKKSLEGKPAPPNVGGFTPEQQFFIAWGQFRGDAIRIEQQRIMVQSDPHPTGKYRVIGSISNMPEFQKAFACKEGSPMVRLPEERCEVW